MTRPRGRIGQRKLAPESFRAMGIRVGNVGVCEAQTNLFFIVFRAKTPRRAAKLSDTEEFWGEAMGGGS